MENQPKMLSFRCPPELASILQQDAKAKGKTLTDVLIDTLWTGLAQPMPEPPTELEEMERLHSEMMAFKAEMEARFTRLKKTLRNLDPVWR